jgi:hypothetical protein
MLLSSARHLLAKHRPLLQPDAKRLLWRIAASLAKGGIYAWDARCGTSRYAGTSRHAGISPGNPGCLKQPMYATAMSWPK